MRAVTLSCLLLVAVEVGADPAVTPQARALVERYVETTGGRVAFEHERVVHVRGRIRSMGLTGTFEQWTMRPDRLLQKIDLGALRIHRGYDGTTGWETDFSSKRVRLLDGRDLEAIQSEAWFENEQWASSDAGGTIKTGTTSYRQGRQFRSLEITPPIGPSRRLWFDVAIGSLDRIVSRRDQHEWTVWTMDSVRTGARVRNRVLTSESPRSESATAHGVGTSMAGEERIELDSIWVNQAIPETLFSAPGRSGHRVTWRRTRQRIDLPFNYGTQHLWVRASINGAPPADFLLDTGCSVTAIDRDYADRIGLSAEGVMTVQGVAGAAAGAFARIRTIRLSNRDGASVTLGDFKVGLVDLGENLEAVLWRPVAGLIGYDVLRHFVVQIDYDRGVVTLTDPKAFRFTGTSAPISMRLLSGIPTIAATVDGSCSGEFVVDTGNGFGLDVHGSLVRRCRLLNRVSRRRQVEVFSGGIGGAGINWFSRLDSIRIGPHVLAEPVAGLTLGSRGMAGSRDYAGNIGNGVLERFVVTFDYERRQLYLEPGQRFAHRDRFSRSGAFLVKHFDRVYAGQVLRGSTAHAAGLRPLDLVTAIDGRPAAEFTPEELDVMFVRGEIGATHTLEIERQGERKTITLELKDVL
jgi:hypothetical protein